ncbi:uncharacterized protein LOC134341194 [Mobula hypostoma]|uniref:uncharacterized protein LOC134341194 n=1 Tax=Mobula hypostoma TaxID=723540 RepID=UPI002FC39AB5
MENRWKEKQGVKGEDIGVVILLEKCLDKVYKPVEVAHQGMFDANTVVVRILWEQRWNSSVKIQKSPSNKEAMDKVKRSVSKCQGSSQEDSGDCAASKHGPIQKSSQDDASENSSWIAARISSIKNKISPRASRQEQSSQFSKDVCSHQPVMEERNMETLRNYLVVYNPPKSGVDSMNILLFSMLGSEESSVINAFSQLWMYIHQPALVSRWETIPIFPNSYTVSILTRMLTSIQLFRKM